MSSQGNRPVSESFYEAGHNWATLDASARLMEESKTTILAQRMAALGDMPVSRAEMIVKASPAWEVFVHKMVDAKTQANKAKIDVDYWRMKHMESQSDAANERTEARLGR